MVSGKKKERKIILGFWIAVPPISNQISYYHDLSPILYRKTVKAGEGANPATFRIYKLRVFNAKWLSDSHAPPPLSFQWVGKAKNKRATQ